MLDHFMAVTHEFLYGLITEAVCTLDFVVCNVREINDKRTNLTLFRFVHLLVVLDKRTVGCSDVCDYATQYTAPHKQPQTISLPTVLPAQRSERSRVRRSIRFVHLTYEAVFDLPFYVSTKSPLYFIG
jgi:hypothetical protein